MTRPVAVDMGTGTVAVLEPDLYAVDRALLEPVGSQPTVEPSKPLQSSGKHDPAARRRGQRRGRERGCWVYITADDLGRAGFTEADPVPWYRVWGGARGRYVVTLFRQP